MVKENELYRCNICGNAAKIVAVGGGELACCGQPMELLAQE